MLNRLVHNIPGVVYRCALDSDWTMEFISESIKELSGYPAEDFIDNAVRTFNSLIHSEDQQKVETIVNQAVSLKEPYSLEYRIIHANGSIRWVYEKGQAIFSAMGEFLALDGAILDISEKKQAEQALVDSENRLRRQQAALIKLVESQEFYRGDLNAALCALTQTAADILEVERVSVWFYDTERTKICLNNVYQLSTQEHSSGLELQQKDYPLYFQALETEEIIAADDAQEDFRTKEFLDSWLIPLGITSMLDIPIRSGGAIVGVICHEQVGSPRHWTFEERNFANYLAYMASLAIEARERASAEAALQYRAETDNLISKISRTFLDQDLDTAIAFALEALGKFTESDLSYIISYSDCQSQLRMTHEWCYEDIFCNNQKEQQFPVTVFPWFSEQLLSGNPINIANIADLPPEAAAEKAHLINRKIQSVLIVPMLNAIKTVGYLGLDRVRAAKTWTQDDINLLKLVGEFIAIAQAKHEAEEALKQAKEDADAANRAKSEFLASMSHELRTPLNAILGFTQVMNRDFSLSVEQRDNLSIISRSGEHLLELINDILEMSKIEAGRTTFNQNSFDLYRLLDSLEEMLRLKTQAKNLQLIFERTPDVPQYIQTDEGKLRQVLINLLGNAIKFTEAGGVILRVRSCQGYEETERRRDGDAEMGSRGASLAPSEYNSECRNRLSFEVEDTGFGIAPEEIDQLFAAFGQTETGRKSNQGTGLGLPISQKFVRLMGGEMTVSSVLGSGSLFAFDIQINLADATKIQDNKLIRKVIGLAAGQPNYRILVVDDRLESRLLLVKLLSSIGFSVQEATNGKEAVQKWETWNPHLIWMDMRMPIMDGYEATKEIKAREKKRRRKAGINTLDSVKIISLTASAFEEERTVVLSVGCDDFMRKPFREEVLWEKMVQHLGVSFIYAESELRNKQTSTNVSSLICDPNCLKVMPNEWLKQLHQAAQECSDDKIFELIEKIPIEQASLSDNLKELANSFLFDRIIEMINYEL